MTACFTVAQNAGLGFKWFPSKPKALGSVRSFKKREKDKMQEDSDLVYTLLQTMALLPRSQYICHLFYFALIVE